MIIVNVVLLAYVSSIWCYYYDYDYSDIVHEALDTKHHSGRLPCMRVCLYANLCVVRNSFTTLLMPTVGYSCFRKK